MIYKLGEKVPKIGKNNFIAENSTIIGDVVTGDNVSIWFGAVLRGDMSQIKIGDNSNIQDNSIIHGDSNFPTTVGKSVTVGHNAIIHGCTIGDECVIGMGSIILNGVNIPNGCLVAAGAVVTPKLKAKSGDMIAGAPAKVIKTLDEKNRNYLKYACNVYIEDIDKYLNKLEIIKIER